MNLERSVVAPERTNLWHFGPPHLDTRTIMPPRCHACKLGNSDSCDSVRLRSILAGDGDDVEQSPVGLQHGGKE